MKTYQLVYSNHKRWEHDNPILKTKLVICETDEQAFKELSKFEEECGGRGNGYSREPFAYINMKYQDTQQERFENIYSRKPNDIEKKIVDILNWNVSYYERLEHIGALLGIKEVKQYIEVIA